MDNTLRLGEFAKALADAKALRSVLSDEAYQRLALVEYEVLAAMGTPEARTLSWKDRDEEQLRREMAASENPPEYQASDEDVEREAERGVGEGEPEDVSPRRPGADGLGPAGSTRERIERLACGSVVPYTWDPPECEDCAELFDPWNGWECRTCGAALDDACADGHPASCEVDPDGHDVKEGAPAPSGA
jgi:hypothetical protein